MLYRGKSINFGTVYRIVKHAILKILHHMSILNKVNEIIFLNNIHMYSLTSFVTAYFCLCIDRILDRGKPTKTVSRIDSILRSYLMAKGQRVR